MPIDPEMKQMLEEINKELQEAKERDAELLQAMKNGNTELISKVDAIQAKLEEMARGQLVSIIEQGERFMRELQRSNTTVEAAIHAEALRDTVKIDKDELKEMLDSAFGSNEEVKNIVKAEFHEIGKALETMNENILRNGNNTHNGFTTVLQNQLSHFATLKELIASTDKTVADLSYTVNRIPTGQGLY